MTELCAALCCIALVATMGVSRFGTTVKGDLICNQIMTEMKEVERHGTWNINWNTSLGCEALYQLDQGGDGITYEWELLF